MWAQKGQSIVLYSNAPFQIAKSATTFSSKICNPEFLQCDFPTGYCSSPGTMPPMVQDLTDIRSIHTNTNWWHDESCNCNLISLEFYQGWKCRHTASPTCEALDASEQESYLPNPAIHVWARVQLFKLRTSGACVFAEQLSASFQRWIRT